MNEMTLTYTQAGRTVHLSRGAVAAVAGFHRQHHGRCELDDLMRSVAHAATSEARAFARVESAFFRHRDPQTFVAIELQEDATGTIKDRLVLQLCRVAGGAITIHTLEELPAPDEYYVRRIIEEAKLLKL